MRRIPRPAPATVIAMIALIVAVGGTAYATGEGKPILGGARNPGSDPVVTAKIALAHLNEFPDYYTRLALMETEAEAYWAERLGDS